MGFGVELWCWCVHAEHNVFPTVMPFPVRMVIMEQLSEEKISPYHQIFFCVYSVQKCILPIFFAKLGLCVRPFFLRKLGPTPRGSDSDRLCVSVSLCLCDRLFVKEIRPHPHPLWRVHPASTILS